MKRLGYKYHLVSIMMIISLICIGFSSWNITNQIGGQSLTGSIKADNVINSSEYIDFDTSADADDNPDGLEIFDYCADGFIVQNTISKTATLKAHYVIDLTKSKVTFADYTSLRVVLTLRGTNGGEAMTFFDSQTVTGTSVRASVERADETISISTTPDGKSEVFTYTIDFNDILSSNFTEYEFTVVYTFTAQYFSSFYEQIDDEPIFYAGAKITGVN